MNATIIKRRETSVYFRMLPLIALHVGDVILIENIKNTLLIEITLPVFFTWRHKILNAFLSKHMVRWKHSRPNMSPGRKLTHFSASDVIITYFINTKTHGECVTHQRLEIFVKSSNILYLFTFIHIDIDLQVVRLSMCDTDIQII